ncbi:MAG: NAD(P)/FAD-dependent oxidoreductase, partial [Novosphingobium sp.]|nr:NAD(P)/FAD-dependent oxidoreductase [Novosphingobium sp.]
EGSPPRALMQKMMSIGVGEEVADEFVPMMIEQGGFERTPDRTKVPGRAPVPAGFKVLIIGGGLTGLLAAIELERAGYDWVLIEKNEDVGGCWWKNRYPGVGVDTPSHFYSYSFEISPEWHMYRPHGADMREYYQGIADKYGLRRNIRFETKVTELRFDQKASVWNVTVEDVHTGQADVIQANAIFNAFGPADRWHMPDIPGIDTFKGRITHSAGYDESIDLKGKKVAVIGTGASSAQIVATIAKEVAELVVFQRSKHWVIDNPESLRVVTEDVKWAMRHIPHYKEWFRFRVFWFSADGLYPNVLRDLDWPEDSPSVSEVNERLRQFAMGHMERKLAGRPDLLEKLTPDFPIFSKRIVMDAGWFDALVQPNATLEVGNIKCITPTGVTMEDGTEYEFDVIICATGFDHAKLAKGLKIVGRDGHDLDVDWADEEERAYMGTTIPGYPNYFLSVGPNAGPNHAGGLNIVSEAQVHYMIECLDAMIARGAKTMEPSQAAFERHNRRIDEQMKQMIWTHPKSKSYYQNSKGRPVGPWPFRLVDMWNEMRGPVEGDYVFDYSEAEMEAAE